jgi:isopropylmalate/homocitrate/citramalate synthase
MPANSPYPGESQEQFAMRQGEQSMNPMAGEAMPGSYAQPQDDGGGEAGIRQAIAERFPDVQPDKLDEIYQAWQEHSHWAQREGQEADLEQFFQQYEADPQGFGGREEVNQELPPELLERMQQGQQGPPMGGQYS